MSRGAGFVENGSSSAARRERSRARGRRRDDGVRCGGRRAGESTCEAVAALGREGRTWPTEHPWSLPLGTRWHWALRIGHELGGGPSWTPGLPRGPSRSARVWALRKEGRRGLNAPAAPIVRPPGRPVRVSSRAAREPLPEGRSDRLVVNLRRRSAPSVCVIDPRRVRSRARSRVCDLVGDLVGAASLDAGAGPISPRFPRVLPSAGSSRSPSARLPRTPAFAFPAPSREPGWRVSRSPPSPSIGSPPRRDESDPEDSRCGRAFAGGATPPRER